MGTLTKIAESDNSYCGDRKRSIPICGVKILLRILCVLCLQLQNWIENFKLCIDRRENLCLSDQTLTFHLILHFLHKHRITQQTTSDFRWVTACAYNRTTKSTPEARKLLLQTQSIRNDYVWKYKYVFLFSKPFFCLVWVTVACTH